MSRYRCVDARKADGFPVRSACQTAGVSVSAYYDWAASRRDSGPSDRAREEARLVDEIRGIHAISGETYG